jgi:hypothetical protein
MTTKTLVKINNVAIQMVENGKDKLIPIKPICEALGIDYHSQRQKLDDDDFLSSVEVLSTSTGADGKKYDMLCLPYEFIFGWLFTINPKNVKEEARPAVAQYRIACYRALYRYFTEQSDFLYEKQALLEKHINDMEVIRHEFFTARDRLNESKKKLNQIREYSFEQWQAEKMQLKLNF